MSRFIDLQAPEKQPPVEKQSPSDTSPGSGELYFEKKTPDGRIVLTEDRAYSCTAFSFPRWKKWLVIVLWIQPTRYLASCQVDFERDFLHPGQYEL